MTGGGGVSGLPGLADKRVLITAGGAGLGRAMAETFAAAGARVLVCDIDQACLDRLGEEMPEVSATRADVSDPGRVDHLFDQVETRLGGLNILINNAGIAGPTGALETLAWDQWRATLAVNLDSQFLCSRRAIPLLRAAGGGGVILNISSTAGLLGMARRAPYVAAKWAVIGLTKTLAMELGPHGIRVNAICPGSVVGPRMDRVIAAEAAAQGLDPAEVRRLYAAQASLGAFVTAQDVAAMALFVCSDAGRRISGQALTVDGNTERLSI